MLSSVRNIAQILRSFQLENPEMSLSELSRKLAIPKSTMFKLLQTMLEEGFLEQHVLTKKYRPGLRLMTLRHTILSGAQLVHEAFPYLHSLANRTGMVAHLTYYENGEVIWITKVQGRDDLPLYSKVGRRAPAYAPASGKAILAFLDSDELEAFLLREWKPLTPNTHLDKEMFIQELKQVKKAGYSIQYEEVELGIASIGVPILNHMNKPIAGLSLAGSASRFKRDTIAQLGAVARQSATEIAHCILSVS